MRPIFLLALVAIGCVTEPKPGKVYNVSGCKTVSPSDVTYSDSTDATRFDVYCGIDSEPKPPSPK